MKKNESVIPLNEGQGLGLIAFRSGIFPIIEAHGKGRLHMLGSHPSDLAKWFKILTPKQILQRLPIVLVQVKACSTSENVIK